MHSASGSFSKETLSFFGEGEEVSERLSPTDMSSSRSDSSGLWVAAESHLVTGSSTSLAVPVDKHSSSFISQSLNRRGRHLWRLSVEVAWLETSSQIDRGFTLNIQTHHFVLMGSVQKPHILCTIFIILFLTSIGATPPSTYIRGREHFRR